MKHLNKFGFTLIELMVAIVIMGILVAVGVPKLTGAVSKSKATEVAPAATAYIKLQSAYVMERKQIGTWKRIGYEKPKSSVFEYSKGDITSKKAIADLGDGLVGWEATNKVGLGDCPLGKKWTVTIVNSGTNDDGDLRLEYKGEVNHSSCAAISGDWNVVGGDITVAENENPKETYKYSQGLFLEETTNSDGKYSLSKALMSGRQSGSGSGSMSNWAGASGYGEGADMTVYGIEGYVFNKGVSSADKTTLSSLLGGKVYTHELILTELYEVSGKEEKVSAGIYKARQSLYYGEQPSGTTFNSILLYGNRDVYVKVNSAGSVEKYCTDETCSQVIDIADNWDTSDVQQIADPFEQVPTSVLASSPLINAHSSVENPIITTAIDKKTDNKAKKVDGIEGYVGSYEAGAATFKPMLSETVSTQISFVRVSSQIFTNEPEPGNLYAATLSLYYGANQKNYEFYERRKVYAVMNSAGTWYYFSDKEAMNKISPNALSFWQSDMGKME